MDLTPETAEQKAKKAHKLNNLVQEKLINNDIEETRLTIDYAKALLALDLEIKGLQNDKKILRAEAKDNGVSVQKVQKALTAMKAIMKSNDNDLLEQENISEVLGDDVDIRTQLSELVSR